MSFAIGGPTSKWAKISAISANYTILDNDEIGIILGTTGSSANLEITFPDAASNINRVLEIVKADSGTKFIECKRAGSDTIRGSATSIYAIQQGESLKFTPSGTDWVLLGDPLRTVNAYIENSGTPTVSWQNGTWISSLTDSGAGDTDINIVAGTFSGNVSYSVINLNNGGLRGVASTNAASAASQLTVIVYRSTTEAPFDANFYVTATGKK